jgi:Carboxypeptidase regulatory-like domain
MKLLKNVTLYASLVLCAALVSAAPAAAQAITTGNIVGSVVDPQGGLLPGATVVATHTATGTTYQAVTQGDGRFSILNVRIGSYGIKATMNGFKDQELKDVPVGLGEDRSVSFKLNLASVSETIVVSAEAPPVNTMQAGAVGNISNAVKESLPTISRSITDIARTNVYFNPMGLNDDAPVTSVAGRSQRYNSFQIDGAVNNDLFGLAAGGGTPGGNAGTQPISFDAVQELQLVVSPYDVRQSGFSGGGINAVTKSGSNEMHGTAYLFGRNQKWVGDGVLKRPISNFKDQQGGASLGGKIVSNKAFYFANVDFGRKTTPSGFSVDGSSGVSFGNEALVDQFLGILKNTYGYDLGPNAKKEYPRATNSNKVFVRADFNIGHGQLTVRHNYVDALNDVGTQSSTLFFFQDGFYRFASKTNSTVAQYNSRFSTGVNEFRVALTRVREHRDPEPGFPGLFPNTTVTLLGSTQVRVGRETFSGANQLDQNIVELTDDYTKVMGKHQITLGTHNEFFKFRNLFIRDFFGNYTFNSIDLFQQGLAQGFAHSFSATSDPLLAAAFTVSHSGFYAGDQWRLHSKLTLTYGMRADFVRYPDRPNANPIVPANFTNDGGTALHTDVVPNNTLYSPRVGFNWAMNAEASEQIRGGVGIFAGRTPYVWISNQYGNTGIDFTRISIGTAAANRIPFIKDPNAQYTNPATIGGATAAIATNEIDLVDPNFKYPSVIRGNLAYDRRLPMGLYATAEVLYAATVNDVRYENLNLQQIRTLAIDGRPVYARNKVPTLGDVLLLTNTTQGDSWTVSADVKRPFRSGLFVDFGYLYGQSTSVMDGTRDQAVSVWGNAYTAGNPNNPVLGRSDYDPGHRVNLTVTYDAPLGKGFTSTLSLFYSGQSGRPYTLLWGSGASTGSVNGDVQNFNDILYLPTATDNLVYTNGTYADLARFLNNHECTASQIGKIMERNSCRSPWSTTLDARIAIGLPFKKTKSEITLDIINLANLMDTNSGVFRYANFNDIAPVSATAQNGVVTGMNLATLNSASFSEFTIGDLRSRWQLQLGARVRF